MNATRALLLILVLGAHRPAAAADLDMPALIGELCAPACQGRRAGEPGGALAASILERRLDELGLAHLDGFSGRSRFFTFRTEPQVESARLGRVSASGEVAELPAMEWRPLAASASGLKHTPVVAVGYGIQAPEAGWDDLAGLSLAGKAVLLVRQVPEGLGDGSAAWRAAGRLDRRLDAARRAGAAAVLVADSPFAEHPERERGSGPDPALGDAGILLAGVSAALADTLLAPAGTDLRALLSRIGRARRPQPALTLPGVLELGIRLRSEERVSRSLGAAIPGRGAAAARWVLVCAHHDHLGRGGDGRGPLHPGADDDASGTAMVLAVAQRLQERLAMETRERRSLAFVLFGGEELGRLGSRSLLARRPAWVDSLDLVINLDMVGRLRDESLHVLGGGEQPALLPPLEAAAAAAGLAVRPGGEAPGGDHESFRAAGVPALLVFTGVHEDYHKPTDTVERLNLAGLAPIRETLAGWLPALLDPDLRPAPAAAAITPREEGAGPVRVAIGIVPGYDGTGGGMAVQDVKAGSAAARAGIRPGDLIVMLGRFSVANIHDYTFALRHYDAGEEVQVVLLRADGRLPVTLRIEERSR